MPDVLLTDSKITERALEIVENNCVLTPLVKRIYDDQFGLKDAQIGDTLQIRKPTRYTVRSGQGLQVQDSIETSVPLVLDKQKGVDIYFSSKDLALRIEDFSERFLEPNLAALSNQIDLDGYDLLKFVPNETGTPGTAITTSNVPLNARAILSRFGAPLELRRLILTPDQEATLVPGLQGLFNPQEKIGKQYATGMLSKNTLGFDFYESQNSYSQTIGAGGTGGTVVVSGANQTGTSVTVSGAAHSTLIAKQGDIVTFAGCDSVNPQSRRDTGSLQQWVITADVTSDGSGNATIPISGPDGYGIILTGAYQTVTASPTNTGAVVFNEGFNTAAFTSARGVAFHRDAFTMACANLPIPNGVDFGKRARSRLSGIKIRLIRAYDVNSDRFPCRSDAVYGWAPLYQQWACRLAS